MESFHKLPVQPAVQEQHRALFPSKHSQHDLSMLDKTRYSTVLFARLNQLPSSKQQHLAATAVARAWLDWMPPRVTTVSAPSCSAWAIRNSSFRTCAPQQSWIHFNFHFCSIRAHQTPCWPRLLGIGCAAHTCLAEICKYQLYATDTNSGVHGKLSGAQHVCPACGIRPLGINHNV